MPIVINSQFESGNIAVVEASNPQDIKLKIRKDTHSEFLQWFYFKVSGVRNNLCQFAILNAGETSYPRGWENYQVVTSTDHQYWFRTPAEYDGNQLRWSIKPDTDQLWFAYFAPYSLEQHANLCAKVANSPGAVLQVLGETTQGRTIDYIQLNAFEGDSKGRSSRGDLPQLWVIGRQHPGESMASWWMEGWLNRLMDQDDAVVRSLRAAVDIHVVPNMNPDGTVLGNLRTNALGVNLNREWDSPSIERSPEVFFVKQKMQETGVAVSLDVHGDEALPYNFIAGTEGIKGWSDERDSELQNVKNVWARINPDFQHQYGYPRTPPEKANLAICSSQIAANFSALAMTLEMPFKDAANQVNTKQGWSPERSLRLGESFVDVAWALFNR